MPQISRVALQTLTRYCQTEIKNSQIFFGKRQISGIFGIFPAEHGLSNHPGGIVTTTNNRGVLK